MPQKSSSRAFTLIEILSTITIIAVLTMMVVFFTVGYIAYAQQNADKQTLTVLNDALTRYKCEGGDITALTSGAPSGHVLAKLATTINWNGYVHQVLQKGVTYPSRSLQGAGYHQSYQFAKFNSYGTPVAPGQDILDRLASQGTPADSTTSAWVANALSTTGSSNYLVLSQPASSQMIAFQLSGTGTVCINWGDGSATFSGTLGSWMTYKHQYSSAGTYGVTIIGNATLFYSADNLGYTGSGTAGPCAFGGDISTMTGLTYLCVQGSNTLSGAVTGLTGLTYLYVNGSNTLSGSVTALTGLTNLTVNGSNTVSGSVTGLTGLTNLNVAGSNTLTGSVTGMTNLNYLANWSAAGSFSGDISNLTQLTLVGINGATTIHGSIANLTSLAYFLQPNSNFDYSAVNWNNYPNLSEICVWNLNQSQVDALLAAMWANKDVAKPRAERYIQCYNGCAAPSAAGYINKANLQAYKSPNNTGPSVWSVITN